MVNIVSCHKFSDHESVIIELLVFADNFPDYCKLRGGVYFVDSMPTTPSGKLLRRRVKEYITNLYNTKSTE